MSSPELFLRAAQYNDNDRAIIAEVFSSCIEWLNAEKATPEQWGSHPWRKDQINEKADKVIKLGINIVEMKPEGAQQKVPIGLYGTGERMPYVPKDPKLSEGEEEDLSNELYLRVLLIHRKYKGHGIGSRLVQKAKEEAREKGKDWLRLDCYGGVEKDGLRRDGLLKYYQSKGFTPVRPFAIWDKERECDWPGMIVEMKV